jgi:hypothetical protein
VQGYEAVSRGAASDWLFTLRKKSRLNVSGLATLKMGNFQLIGGEIVANLAD